MYPASRACRKLFFACPIPITKKILFFVLFFATAFCKVNAQDIYINEIMASNSTTIADATGEYSDWFEIYNAGATNFSLSNCYVSNNYNTPQLFRFSGNIEVPANGFIIIWASNDVTRGATHVTFKLSASGAGVFLFKPDGITLLDSVTFGAQRTDVSYARLQDGAPSWRFFIQPTPDASNNTSTGYIGFLNKPSFSVNAGFYKTPFALNITSVDVGVKIIYTLDGSVPAEENINPVVYRYKNQYPKLPGEAPYPFLIDSFHSNIFTAPFSIKNISNLPNHLSLKSSTYDDKPAYFPRLPVDKGVMVRAVAVKDGYVSSDVNTATYFVRNSGINKYTLPLVSVAVSPDDLFNWDSGIYVAGTDFEQWRAANPNQKVFPGAPANYRRDVTERPSSMEMFNENSVTEALQINNGTGIHGGGSRSKPQKSFRLYFRSGYGASDINYKIFPDQSYKDYARLILRNSGGDWGISHICDMSVQKAVRHLNFNTQDARPCVTFVNGEYWGVLSITERYDWHYFDQHYGIDEDEIDYLENNASPQEGDSTDYVKLRKYISTNTITNAHIYDSITKRIDIENYIDYNVSEIFYGNTDWPANNIGYFRKRVAFTPNAAYGLDGRYRWVMYDNDQSLGNGTEDVSGNTLQTATGTRPIAGDNPPSWATLILKKLTNNQSFRKQFITRYADLLNTSFLPDYIISSITYYHDLIEPEMPDQIKRWRQPTSMSVWNKDVNAMDTFAVKRPAFARAHLRAYFSLGTEKKITLDVSDTVQGFIHINTVDITPSFPGVPKQAYPWNGFYYSEIPVTLIAKAKPGYHFLHWEGASSSTDDSITVTLSQAMNFKAVFAADGLRSEELIAHTVPSNIIEVIPNPFNQMQHLNFTAFHIRKFSSV